MHWRRAVIGALVSMVVTAAVLYLPFGRWTFILAIGCLVFLWIYSREFGIWCQSMSATALGAVAVFNVAPTGLIFAKWGDATLGAQLEGQPAAVSITLILASVAFGGLAYLFRKPTMNQRVISSNQSVATKGDNSPAAGRDLTKTEIKIEKLETLIAPQTSGALLESETVNAAFQQYIKTIAEKDGQLKSQAVQLAEKDELVVKLKEGMARAQCEAEKGETAAKEALEAIRKSNDTEKLQRVLEAEADTHKTDFIERCLEISAVAFLRGDIDTARSRVEEVLKLDPDEFRGLNHKGHIERLLGNLDAAESAYRRILDAGESDENPRLVAIGAGNLGNILRTRGDLDAAEAMHRKALALAEKIGWREGTANQYSSLGNILATRGDVECAETMYLKALKINEELGRLEGMASQCGNLGNILFIRGDLDGAEAMHRKSLDIETKLGRLQGVAADLGNLGTVLEARGDLDEAEQTYRKALNINEKLGRLEGAANQYGNLGNVLRTRGDLDGAETMYRKGLKIHEKLGGREGMANDYGNLGGLFEERGDLAEARKHLEKARGLYEQIGMPHMVQKIQEWLDGLPKADQ